MGTTNYTDTFIAVAADCGATAGEEPPARARPTVARLTYELLSAAPPYSYTSDDVIFAVHAARAGIPEEDRARAREEFFSRPQACLRSSPLGKTYGWGSHHDAEGRVALVAVESERYRRLAAGRDEEGRPVTVTRAMRTTRR